MEQDGPLIQGDWHSYKRWPREDMDRINARWSDVHKPRNAGCHQKLGEAVEQRFPEKKPTLLSSCGARGGFLPRHDEDLRWR